MNQKQKDRVYAIPQNQIEPFRFNSEVARVFPDMIRRSVPGYATVIAMTEVVAAQSVQPGSHCYDLGCSLGASSLAIRQGVGERPCRIIGIDSSAAMIQRAREGFARMHPNPEIELVEDDICNHPLENASLVILNYTLQFVPIGKRLALLQRIHSAMRPGGRLVLSEKIRFEDAEEEALQIDLHHAFKRANGYDDLEISQKRSALERVLLPETLKQHQQRLKQAGFRRSNLWFQCFNFVSLVAEA